MEDLAGLLRGLRVVVGTALLAAIVSLDGDGSTTFMITVSAMYPLYKRLKMSLVVMTGVAAMANGVMNTLPWGGPTARAATASPRGHNVRRLPTGAAMTGMLILWPRTVAVRSISACFTP